MKTSWALVIGLGLAALTLCVTFVAPYFGSRNSLRAANERATVGTSGRANPATALPDSPATIRELETITGAIDGHELIGRRVDLHADAQEVGNNNSFWVGTGDSRVLVVPARGTRTGQQRAYGDVAGNANGLVSAGSPVSISGTIQQMPAVEERFRWGLNDSQREALKDQTIYIRADVATQE